MQLGNALVSVLTTISTVYACEGDGHDHALHKRLVPSAPLTPPSRPLEWGDVNIIHTTDTHGWLLGHQKTSFPEPNYRCVHNTRTENVNGADIEFSGDLGDFASFVTHMKALARVSFPAVVS
jgi:2',3'-cyclic-nucleotide 2'-phosphodiesterase (5'-nucleotidase family)